jgi:hypothetical protein
VPVSVFLRSERPLHRDEEPPPSSARRDLAGCPPGARSRVRRPATADLSCSGHWQGISREDIMKTPPTSRRGGLSHVDRDRRFPLRRGSAPTRRRDRRVLLSPPGVDPHASPALVVMASVAVVLSSGDLRPAEPPETAGGRTGRASRRGSSGRPVAGGVPCGRPRGSPARRNLRRPIASSGHSPSSSSSAPSS